MQKSEEQLDKACSQEKLAENEKLGVEQKLQDLRLQLTEVKTERNKLKSDKEKTSKELKARDAELGQIRQVCHQYNNYTILTPFPLSLPSLPSRKCQG